MVNYWFSKSLWTTYHHNNNNNNDNNNDRELIECFWKLKEHYNLKKNIQCANTHNYTNQWYISIQILQKQMFALGSGFKNCSNCQVEQRFVLCKQRSCVHKACRFWQWQPMYGCNALSGLTACSYTLMSKKSEM